MSNESSKLFSFHNVGLFSDHFLSKRLPTESPYWTSDKVAAQATFDNILGEYKKFHSTYGHPNEAQTEDGFIRPVLNTLGYSYIPQTSIKDKGVPDYSLFADEKTKKEAGSLKVKEQEAFYGKAIAICDAKYWGRPLDIKIPADKRDTFKNSNPSFQIINYLVGANVDWGILTNGKLWRLYYQEASSRSSNFYEVDLEDLLHKGKIEDFLYFYFFFRKEAFIKGSHGKSFLELVLERSTQYATELSGRLKDKIFDEIFPHLAKGFLHYRKKELGIQTETEETLKVIYNGTLTLLYRLLFILYAEDRDLLPVKEKGYGHYSLARLKQRVAELRDKKMVLSKLSTDLWSDLDTLFKIIDIGDAKLNIPTYNGGLFSHKNPQNDFLKTHKVPDPWLVEALDHLAREVDKETDKPQFIDYSELEVRHLGSVYEGLLEFHLRIADEDKALVREKGRELYKPLAEIKNPKEVVKKGALYLENDKHERKSTGSYYTPDYIVKYIVHNAVGPVLEAKLKEVQQLFSEVESLRIKAHRATAAKGSLTQELNVKKQQATDELFSLKVLDPAMGSGHFLVDTVDFLSDHIIKFLNDHPDNPVLEEIEKLRSTILDDLRKKGIQINEQKLIPTNLVRRMVMKRCVYGVDLNPMAVELAKLSLWLHSFTLGAPLSFLDHHLKCGNSLIGTTVKTVKQSMEEVKVEKEGRYVDWEGREKVVPEKKALYLFGSQFSGLLSATELMRQVGELTDSTFEEVQESQEKYEEAADALKPFKLILDLWISEYFGNKGAQNFLTHGGDIEAFLKGNGRLSEKIRKLREETDNFSQGKHFFHWELEFPEVFYERARDKENPGFGTVIGNPPWGAISSFYEMPFIKKHYHSAKGSGDYFALFQEKGIEMLRLEGTFGQILPSGWQSANESVQIREFLAKSLELQSIVGLPYDVFEDAYVNSTILIGRKRRQFSPNNLVTSGRLRLINFSPREKLSTINESDLRWEEFNYQSWFHDNDRFEFYTFMRPSEFALSKKLQERSAPLEKMAEVQRGITPFSTAPKQLDQNYAVCLDGELRRYSYSFSGEMFVQYNQDLPEYKESIYFTGPRLLLRELISRQFQLQAAYVSEDFITNKSVQSILSRDTRYSLLYILALLNSRLMAWFHLHRSAISLRDDFPKIVLDETRRLPIRNIPFTTDQKNRPKFFAKSMALYERCLAKNDLLCVTEFIDHCLKQKPEQADVVHDLLAFLAQRMMEMNKKKQVEIKGFLEWLETTIGAKVDSLKNKTKIKAHHEGSLEDLVDVLKENRKSLKVNPASKDFFDLVKVEFQKSVAKLIPLKNQIAITDRLIDLIVYRLYGLTDEEIKVVEGTQSD